MKAILIDAAARTLTEIDYEYNTMREHFPRGICIGATFDNGDVLYVDDEALLYRATVAFRVKQRPDGQPMMSNGLLTGRDNPDPRSETTLPPAFTIEQLAHEIEWMTVTEALAWFRERADQPAVVVTDGQGKREVVEHWRTFLDHLEGRA